MRSNTTMKEASFPELPPWHARTVDDLFAELKTGPSGLSDTEAKARLGRLGANVLPGPPPVTALPVLLRQLQTPFVLILAVAAAVSWTLADFLDAAFIVAAIAINIVFGFIQEWRAERALEALRRVIRDEATVVRDGVPQRVPRETVVPGDILLLTAGERVAADARLLDSEALEVNESILTGESVPARKTSSGSVAVGAPIADRPNMVFAGTAVTRGEGSGIVVATGIDTEVGKIARALRDIPEQTTPLEGRMKELARTMTKIVLGLALFIFFAGVGLRIPFLEIFTTAAAVAVAAVPEGLVVAVTVILTIGMRRLMREKALVRRLRAAETLGSVTVICVDKTGTITEGSMRVVEVLPARIGEQKGGSEAAEEAKEHLLHLAILANEAWIEEPPHRDGHTIGNIVGEPTDAAMLRAALEAGLHDAIDRRKTTVRDRLPFSSENQFIAALADVPDRGQRIIALKGAAEKLLPSCTRLGIGQEERVLTPQERGVLTRRHNDLSARGLRMIAVAQKTVPRTQDALPPVPDILSELTFVGFIALEDPVRPGVREALHMAQQAGIKTVLITGDHVLTARSVAEQVGILTTHVVDGTELAELSDAELAEKLRDSAIFARTAPQDKFRIVSLLKSRGEVVAMTGDGINDAPAMKSADIGVALGSGTEVARSSAELVLLDDDFSTLVVAIREGRVVFDNIRKVVLFLLIDTFSEIILVSGSILAGVPLALLATQILFINLIEDGPPAFALAFEPGERDIMRRRPRSPRESVLTREHLLMILTTGIMVDFFVFFLYLWMLHHGIDAAKARTVAFSIVGLNSFTEIFSLRNLRIPLWRTNPFANPWLLGAVALGISGMVAAVRLPALQEIFRTVPLGRAEWLLVVGVSIAAVIPIEIAKAVLRRIEVRRAA